MTTPVEDAVVDLSNMTDRDILEAIYNRVMRPRPYTAHPLWTDDECDNLCQLTATPVPGDYMQEIAADDGVNYWVHPGIYKMMEDNGVDTFPLDWLNNEEVLPGYLETPTRKRGRPASDKPTVERHVYDMANWTIDDVPHMVRKDLMTAAKKEGVTALVKAAGGAVLHEGTEWLRAAVLAKMNGEEYLPAFMADVNKKLPQVRIHKPVEKKPAPTKVGTTPGAKPGAKPIITARTMPGSVPKKPLKR